MINFYVTPQSIENLPDFWRRVERARRRVLALDYDGTLAPFRIDRSEALPLEGVIPALEQIINELSTRVIIVSGRTIEDLMMLMRGIHVELIGEHGHVWKKPNGEVINRPLSEKQEVGLQMAHRLARELGYEELLEFKGASIALHTRGKVDAEAIHQKILELWKPLSSSGDLDLMRFNGGLELIANHSDKGSALLDSLRDEPEDTLVVYIGDDTTDENVFRKLQERGGDSFGIRVGYHSESQAHGFIEDIKRVPIFLYSWYDVVVEAEQKGGHHVER